MDPHYVSSIDTTDLLIQQGPSCWLFVVEAVAAPKLPGLGLTTNYLRMAMYAYPDSEDVDDRMRGLPKESRRRTVALGMTVDHIDGMLAALTGWKARGGPRSEGDQIPRYLVARYARQNLGSDMSLNFVSFLGETGYVDDVIAAYAKARTCADGIYQLAVAMNGDESHALLSTGATMIEPDAQLSDVGDSVGAQALPCFVHVRRRFTLPLDQVGKRSVDLTSLPDSAMRDTSHAIMLVSYNQASGTVTYKDPNYGNMGIIVSLEQFRAMGGGKSFTIRPFLIGQRGSALAKVLKG